MWGLLHCSLWGYVIATLIMTQITIAAVTLYLHRSQSHRALEFHPVISHFFRFWLWITTGQVTKEWVAVHRCHHARCDKAGDPHSPQQEGINTILLQGTELYRKATKNADMLEQFGKGTPNDWIERHVYSRYSWLGVTLMLLTDLALFGVPGITIWAVQMLWIPMFAAGVINGIGHYFGYRNFEVADYSRNIVPWGIFIGGEELHNNHHAYASSAKLSNRWWEVDIGWFYIRVLQTLGLVKVRHSAPQLSHNQQKTTIDRDTLTAVITSRFQIMAHYSKDVIRPVLRRERQKADASMREILCRARELLSRERSLMDTVAWQRLRLIIDNNKSLQLVYQFRLKLQAIWERASANQRELIEALQDWCRQAEATGVDVLQEFAGRLKGCCLV